MTTIEKANGQGLNKSQYKNKVFTPKEMIDYSDGGIVSKELIHTQAVSLCFLLTRGSSCRSTAHHLMRW